MFQPRTMNQYNDGVASLYRPCAEKNSFGAKINVTKLDDMEFIVKLCFERMSRRQQDQDYAEQAGYTLSEKVRTPYRPGIDTKCKATISGYLYDVEYIDTDPGKTELYLYLQEVRKLDS